MKHADKLRLATDLHRMRRILEKGDMTKNEGLKIRQEIARDEDHSDKWKADKLEKLAREESKIYRACGKAAYEVAESLQATVNKAANSFDYNDESFQNALRTLQTLGKKTPFNVQQSIVDTFTGNPDALRSIKELFAEYQFSTSEIDRRLRPFDEFGREIMDDENFTRFVVYATTEGMKGPTGQEILPTWEPMAVKNVLGHYETAFQVDGSVNPYAAAVRRVIDTTGDAMTRARAERFMRTYGDKLTADDPDACERAAAAIKNNFKPGD